MKKTLIILCGLCSMGFSSLAQIVQVAPSTKMEDGLTIELTGSPFSTDHSLLSPGYFRARLFLSESAAIRMGLWGSVSDRQVAPESVENSWYMSLRPGFEYRFGGNEKVTPYAAADVVFDMRQSKFESSSLPAITGAVDANGRSRGFWQAGLYLGAGMDYQINSHFYVGMEAGFQYAYRQNAEIQIGGELIQKSTRSNQFDTVFMNALRIGFKLF